MNKLQRTLCIGAGIISLGLLGSCSDYSKYNFDGRIGEDRVKFESVNDYGIFLENDLTVGDKDGKVTKYLDNFGEDLILDEVQVVKNGETTHYFDSFLNRKKMDKFQEEFDNYLKEILKAKSEESFSFFTP